jgi:hypothetical protein
MKTIEETRRGMFEAWHRENFKAKYSNGHPTRDMHNGKYAERYTVDREQDRWIAFNAALDAVVIELPELAEPREPAYAFDDSWRDGYTAASRYRRQCRAAIESTNLGLKIR